MRTLIRTLTSAAAVAALAVATPALAQGPSPAASEWVGTWTGPFTTDGPYGTMVLSIGREDGAWRIMNEMQGDEVPPASEPMQWKVEGNAFSFSQVFGEFDVLFRGTLEGGVIKGTLEAYQAGSLVGSGNFDLKKS